MPYVVRAFDLEKDDVDRLTELLHRAYAELLEQGLEFTATRQSSETTRERIQGGCCFVAEDEGQYVGTATVEPGGPDHRVRHYRLPSVAVFSQFGVDPSRRSEGIGGDLLRACKTWAAHRGLTEIALDTSEQAHHLIELYRRWGFELVDTHDWRPGVNYLSVVMSRRLSER
jgi:GNAT superfamily N-acetyltransferase